MKDAVQPMKVFVCWSGRRSQEFASLLKSWLQGLMPRRIDARLSIDIQKGTLWFHELDKALEGARLGIVCLTDEALRSPWIHYEAGILSRALREADHAARQDAETPQVFPVLFGTDGSRLSGPLAAYQSTSAFSRDDMWRFVQAVARRAGVRPESVRQRFDAGWGRVLARFDGVSRVPIHEVFPDIESLFNGRAFNEPIEQQLRQDWLARHDEIRRVHWTLREKDAAVKAACRAFASDLFSALITEVDAYARDLSPLIGQQAAPIDERGRVVLEQPGIGHACERRRASVLTLVSQLVDPRQAPIFDDAFQFARASNTEARKKLVHREAARLRARPAGRAPTDAERRRWLDSDWDLDHILFYELLRDRPLGSFGLLDAVRRAEVEFERVRFRAVEVRTSLMALYYSLDGLRRMLASHRAQARTRARAEVSALIAEVLAFINQPGRGSNAPIRAALHDIADLFGLAVDPDRIVRSARTHGTGVRRGSRRSGRAPAALGTSRRTL
jgi:hypothetical protein